MRTRRHDRLPERPLTTVLLVWRNRTREGACLYTDTPLGPYNWARSRLEVVARVGLVEAFVGQREVGDDGVGHRHRQCGPVEPGRIDDFRPGDAAIDVNFDAVHDSAAPAFDDADTAARRAHRVQCSGVFYWTGV